MFYRVLLTYCQMSSSGVSDFVKDAGWRVFIAKQMELMSLSAETWGKTDGVESNERLMM
jgi:hypothetical protein